MGAKIKKKVFLRTSDQNQLITMLGFIFYSLMNKHVMCIILSELLGSEITSPENVMQVNMCGHTNIRDVSPTLAYCWAHVQKYDDFGNFSQQVQVYFRVKIYFENRELAATIVPLAKLFLVYIITDNASNKNVLWYFYL